MKDIQAIMTNYNIPLQPIEKQVVKDDDWLEVEGTT
jgi:hypothetical protein